MDSTTDSLGEYKRQFQRAVDGRDDWREQARRCYRYYMGKQWDASDVEKLKEQGRPALTVNMVRPFINLLSGFYSFNATEPDFLPRTIGDDDLCRIAKAVTKWVYDGTNYQRHKVRIFTDKCIGGEGVYKVHTKVNYESLAEDIVIERVSPFSLYVDPECVNPDLSDANYLDFASWVDKEELKRVYPEFKDEIDAMVTEFAEEEKGKENSTSTWWDSENKKVRLVEHWYKEHSMQTVYDVMGILVKDKDIDEMLFNHYQQTGMIMTKEELRKERLPKCQMRQALFCGGILLEDMDSPYTHNKFPFVLDFAYYTGENDVEGWDEPHGVVYDMLDLQLEKNKVRSQAVHLINTTSNKGYKHWGLSDEDKRKLNNFGSTPGVTIEVPPEGLLEPFQNPGFPSEILQMDAQNGADMRSVTGINEEMLGTDVPANASGRAIELRQKQAATQIAVLFDGSKQAEQRIVKDLLWGDQYSPGLIPQFMNEEKVIRIMSDDGQAQFVGIAPTGQKAGMTEQGPVYDLSRFEFDVVMGESPNSPTQRAADFMKLLDAQKFGVPIPPELFLDYVDIPNKPMVKQKMAQMAEMAVQAAAANGKNNMSMQTADATAGQPVI